MTTTATTWADDAAQTMTDLIRLPEREHPLRLQQHYCDNPACHCNEALLTLTEADADGRALAEPLSVDLRLNLVTWQENSPPPRPDEANRLVQSFLDELSPALKSEFQTHYREGKEIAQRLADYRLDPKEVETGTLLSYPDVIAEEGGLSSGGTHYTFRFQLQNQDYLVEDLYCANPACRCKEAHLLFFRYSVDHERQRAQIEKQVLARVPLRGKAKIEDIFFGTHQQAKALLAAWQQAYPKAQALLKTRYDDIKALGKRSLDERPARPAARLNKRAAKIGRNAPCPCGSGKKYKKCCG